MERETKTVVTPIGKQKIVLKAWITGREKRELRNVFLAKVKIAGGVAETDVNSVDVINAAENKAIDTVVVSIDGDSKNLLDKILDMRSQDYNFVIGEINKITREEDFLK